MSRYWTLETEEQRRHFNEHIAHMLLAGKKPVVKFEEPLSHITQKQVNAEHLWFRQVAQCLQDAGLDMRQIISEDVDIPVTEHLVKENLYKPLLEVMTGKVSTMDQNTVEPSKVAEVLARHFAQKFGVSLPRWPSHGGPGD